MLKHKFIKQEVRTKRDPNVKLRTVPNQSMTVRQMVEKFVRGLDVELPRKRPVYMPNNSEFDYEALSRLDFAEKAAMADQLKQRANEGAERLEEIERRNKARKEKAATKPREDASGVTGIETP